MKTKLLILAAASSCVFSSATFAMTKVEYTAQKDTIRGDYKVSRDKCNSLKANAKDVCMSEAKGDAAYDTAKEKCDDSSGNAKTICKKDAKAAHVKANDEARVVRVSAQTGKLNTDVPNMATKDENEANYKADYKAAITRCDGMAGAAKDTCTTDAKVKFGMK